MPLTNIILLHLFMEKWKKIFIDNKTEKLKKIKLIDNK